MERDGPNGKARRLWLEISTSEHSTVVLSDVLRLAAAATGDHNLALIATGLVAEKPARAAAESVPAVRSVACNEALRSAMLARFVALERAGRPTRNIPMIIAREFAADPRDPQGVESLARKIRRWRS